MNRKAFVISLYFVALFITMRHWYKAGNSGMPDPRTVAGPSYLYGVLALTADFTQDLSVVLAAGLTVGLYYATTKKQTTTGKQKKQPAAVPKTKQVKTR